jgi:Ni2+-binding GTPase involved in maturation of urease and hydrogenase
MCVSRSRLPMILNKVDLLPYVEFDVERAIAHACEVNPGLPIGTITSAARPRRCARPRSARHNLASHRRRII